MRHGHRQPEMHPALGHLRYTCLSSFALAGCRSEGRTQRLLIVLRCASEAIAIVFSAARIATLQVQALAEVVEREMGERRRMQAVAEKYRHEVRSLHAPSAGA